MYLRIAAAAIFSVGVAYAGQCLGQETAKPLITSPVYTKPQQLVDMDHGRRMNIYCLGSGSPAVILDAGMGDSTISWALVQPAIAARTKVCSYDRAGLGFSDGSSRPSTAANIAEDLHALLKAAHVAPPYVLVGHSAAGMYIRVYADRYPDEVVGMVSVEGSHEDQWVRGWAIGAPGQQAKWDAFLKDYGSCVDEAKRGLVPETPAYKKCVGDPDPRFSPAINAAQARYAATARWQAAAASERQSVAYASADQARATRRHYGDMPIIVLTHSPYPKAKDETQDERNQRTLLWESLHLEVAAMSTRGVNEIVPDSGHYIQYEHPQVVIDAIEQALSVAQEDMRRAK
ncbi:alpha/beta hydrolase [Rhodanobacter sp. DHB23]|uniref:alpha/beta fold hydrolase n=1 Tax=Rhodanobacter sp. DHB23 TaxID=2775923 RepID=UPI001785E70A|nr:alpha/beta hydrolase [Rhodanobacter sp. DHB23]MBD8872348.1 alpha/beta hydrolase [Rhodanobacter sp. DHB23]